MRLKKLRLENVRNHAGTSIECSSSWNIFLGKNGEGKTTILEGISYLCFTKSFSTAQDATVLQLGKKSFSIFGEILSDQGVSYDVLVNFDAEQNQKTIAINKARVEKHSSVVGQFPLVVLSPEHGAITFGAPVDRRKFLDTVLSQASSVYFENLLEYRRIVRQRNKILLDAKISRSDCSDLLEPWDESLVNHGAKVIQKRVEFLEEFQPFVSAAIEEIAGSAERPQTTYESNVPFEAGSLIGAIEESFRRELDGRKAEERRMGSSLVGPHRDEIALSLNGMDLRRYASQGQHKTFLVGLKLAEFSYLRDRRRETPLLLLDDVFSELDEERAGRLAAATTALGQTFITATDERAISGQGPQDGSWQRYFVRGGTVSHVEAPTFVN
ncbi:MAG: DNA replication/repair protein RecF [Bacteroidota bacterium]